MCLNQDLQIFASNLTSISYFHPLEVVNCGSETQLQEGENYNFIMWYFEGRH